MGTSRIGAATRPPGPTGTPYTCPTGFLDGIPALAYGSPPAALTPVSAAPQVGAMQRSGRDGMEQVMRLVGYVRVSSHDADEVTIEHQAKSIRRWARANGHRVVRVFRDEGVSGAKAADERSGLTDALRALRDREAVGLVVRDLDRLARSVTVQEAVLAEVWQRSEARVFTTYGEVVRDDPDDPMRTAMREMVGVFAGLERRMIAKRLRDGRAAKRAKGGHPQGRYPYGWTPEGKHPAQQAALALMVLWRNEGRSTREIARLLNEGGHPTARDGATWHSPTVARILARYPRGSVA